MKSFGGRDLIWRGSIFLVLSLGSAFAGTVSYTCDPSIATYGPAGLCNYLNTSISNLYGSEFTNANADIYIEYSNLGSTPGKTGLSDNTTEYVAVVPYSEYQSALQNESTDPAKASVPATEPAIFGGDNISLTPALSAALGISNFGTTSGGSLCFTPGSDGCYDGILQVNIPSDLDTGTGGQGYTYRTLGGSTTGTSSNYDFFSVVEHETNEVLGTASCIDTTAGNGTLTNPLNCASAVDLYRYTAPGTRTFDTIGANAYFSANGGVTDYQGQTYNNQANGQDWADFAQSCTFVQDAVGCLNQSFDITTDGPDGTAGPEVAILNAVGYNLVTPEPGTLGMLAFGFAALAVFAKRRVKVTAPE